VRTTSGREAARLRAGLLLRARWASVLAIGLIAGLGGGVVIGLVTIARDTASAIDRYVEHIGEPDVAVTICPPRTDAAAAEEGACFTYDPVREAEALRRLPGVRAAARVSPTPVAVRLAGGGWRPSFAWVMHDAVEVFEHPPLVAGRAPELGRHETMINEATATMFGLAPGDHVEVAPLSVDEVSADAATLQPRLATTDMEVTGIVRLGTDLVEAQTEGSLANIDATMFLGPGWADDRAMEDYYRYQTGLGVWLDDGVDVDALLDEAAPGQLHVADAGLTADTASGPSETVDYQARAALAAAALLALAGMVLVGQILGRQARRELDDARTLQALGMTRRSLTWSALPRWLVTAAVAGAVAAVTAVLVRPLGPVGIARRAAPAGGGVNLAVVGAGVVAVCAFVAGVGLLSTYRGTLGRRSAGRRSSTVVVPSLLSAEASVGMAFTVNAGRGRRSWAAGPAVAGSAVAIAAAIAVPTLHSSLDHLTADPSRYGVGWDAVATGLLGKASAEWMAGQLQTVDDVVAAAGSWGTSNATIDGRELYLYGFEDVAGLPTGIVPTITAGRAPAAADEVALGAQSMDDADARIGDTVTVSYLDRQYPMRVVGEVVVNDNYEVDPGRGGVVTAEWLRASDPAGYPGDYMIRFAAGHGADGLADLQQRFPGLVSAPLAQDDIVNLRRLESWPALLAGLSLLMAGAAFVHALVTSVRAQRHPLAVVKALGWSRVQVGLSIFWHASFLALPAILVGVPAGVVLGRWGWGMVARSLGIPSAPVIPMFALLLIAAVALVAANLLAVWPSWRAAHISAVDALRTE
jgi:hypothetical protein